ncbi:MAG: O-antigen ligase family protein [Lentisphaerae bacterium]|nr:O-antigen ligase family protein [Lentisphaerota bacterium]
MLALKYIIFFGALLVGVPLLTVWTTRHPRRLRGVATVHAFSIAFCIWVNFNFFPDPGYSGTSRGMETSISDLFALALLGAIFLLRRGRINWLPPGWWAYGLYFLAGVISLVNADSILYGVYELWKMMWMWVCFLTVYNYVLHTRDVEAIQRGLALTAIYSLIVVLRQKYIIGIFQTPGPFAHQNSMAMFYGMSAPVFLAHWLDKRQTGWDRILYPAAFVAATGCVFSTLSRGAIFFFPLGCLPVIIRVLFRRWNKRKIKIVLTLCLVGIIGVAKMGGTIVDRFLYASPASRVTRVNLAIAARNMANDKILGVGINNWGIKINPPYEYAEHQFGKVYEGDFKDGLVETIYLLVAAECGWWGMGVLLLFFLYFFMLNMLNIFYYRRSGLAYLPVAIAGGLLNNYCQSVLEWVLKQSPSFYEQMVFFAIIAAMSTIYRESRRTRLRAPAAAPKP